MQLFPGRKHFVIRNADISDNLTYVQHIFVIFEGGLVKLTVTLRDLKGSGLCISNEPLRTVDGMLTGLLEAHLTQITKTIRWPQKHLF